MLILFWCQYQYKFSPLSLSDLFTYMLGLHSLGKSQSWRIRNDHMQQNLPNELWSLFQHFLAYLSVWQTQKVLLSLNKPKATSWAFPTLPFWLKCTLSLTKFFTILPLILYYESQIILIHYIKTLFYVISDLHLFSLESWTMVIQVVLL